jgi:hypothetical protein
LEVKEIDEVEEIEEWRAARGTGQLGGGAVEHSQLMIAWISSCGKYKYSTSIYQIGLLVRKILQGEENNGVELTVYPCNGSRAMECGGQVRPVDRG